MKPVEKRTRLAVAAKRRLVNAGPEARKRIEKRALSAIGKSDWTAGRRLLHLRLEMRAPPTAEEQARIGRILKLID